MVPAENEACSSDGGTFWAQHEAKHGGQKWLGAGRGEGTERTQVRVGILDHLGQRGIILNSSDFSKTPPTVSYLKSLTAQTTLVFTWILLFCNQYVT